MTSDQAILWFLWGITFLSGFSLVLIFFKLRLAERFLPPWNELKEIEATLPVRREELRQVAENIRAYQAQIGELEATVGQLRIVKEWQEKNPEAPARIQQLMVDLERAKSEFAAVQQKLAQDEARSQELQSQISVGTQEWDRLTQQQATLRQQCEVLTRQERDLTSQVQALEHQGRQHDLKLATLRDEIQRQEGKLAALQSKVQEAEAHLTQSEARVLRVTRETQQLDEKKVDLKKEIEELQGEVKILKERRDRLESTVKNLEQRESITNSRLDGLRSELEGVKERLEKVLQQEKQAETERAAAFRERDKASAVRDSALAEFEGLKKSIDTYKELAKGLQAQFQQVGASAKGNYADLFTPLSFPALPPAQTIPSEKEALKATQAYIRGKGLIFSPRVLYAFHTSLKISEISPLLVLAGISGTGKSELPRHYADGMGIHFLLTSVQPRWDSPQDLFGFYNYLEHRYKATDLSRAMVQFELFKLEKMEEWQAATDAEILEHDRSDRLLMVLLDEMNLARTEYYFSEFLSKLETRRMVDESAPEDRSRAEIELDMGSLMSGQKGIRIYPGKNILFVGTMNEDESTQALSDKVIDRASVLRFWRPRKTNPDLNAGVEAKPTEGITFDAWKGWIQEANNLEGHSGQVDSWIEGLNNALDQLGRPFAYRVGKAIRTYVANYPRWVPNWHKQAMADQIEQKIFPKLRGIEPQQGDAPKALKSISEVIGQLEDEPLKKAFELSKDKETFMFRGVDRDDSVS